MASVKAPAQPQAAPASAPEGTGDRDRRITAVVVWQAVVGVGLLGALLATLLGAAGPEGALGRVILSVLLAAFLLADVASVPLLVRRRPLGRGLAVGVDYLGFLAATVLLLQQVDAFVGVDALGATFSNGVPFLALGLVGYLMTGWRRTPDRDGPLQRPGRIVMLVAFAGFLVAVGLFPALATFAARLAEPVAAGLLVAAVLFALAAWYLWRRDVARVFGATTEQEELLNGFLFVSPNVLGFFVFFAGPLLFSLFVSFHEWDALGTQTWTGLDNYIEIFSLDLARIAEGQNAFEVLDEGYQEFTRVAGFVIGARDPLFWISIRNVLLFSLMAVPLAVGLSLLLASLLNSQAPGMRVFRALYFVPTVAGVVGVTLIWKQLLNASVGFVNYLITQVTQGLDALPLISVSDPELRWLSDSDVALFSLVIVFVWQYIGYNAILFLAGLQSIPGDLYEAAHLDGANAWQRFRNITLPQLAPTTFFVVATTGILALQLFSEAVILFANFTPPGAGPNNATLTPVGYLYQEGFQRFSQGYASAVAWVLFALIFAFTFIQFQRQRAEVA